MTSLLRFLDVQVGLHADASDYTTPPVSYRRIQVIGGNESLMPRVLTQLSRNDIQSLDGRGFTHINGPIDLSSDCAPVCEFKGVNSNTGVAFAPSAWLSQMEQGELLTSMFGSLPVATTGAAPILAATGHTPTTLTYAAGTAPVVGEMILFQTNAGPRVRTIVGVAGQVATLDRSYGTLTPTAASTVIRACRFDWALGVVNHVHVGFKVESSDVLSEFLGCAPVSFGLSIPTGAKLQATYAFAPTDVNGFQAPQSPVTTYPNAGSPIVGINAEFFVGSERFFVDEVSVNYTTGNSVRSTPSSRSGRMGGVAADKRGGFTIAGKIRNELGARGGIQRDTGTETLRTILGDVAGVGSVSAERDVLLVIGRAAGAALAIRFPTAALSASMADVGGVAGIAFTATATRSASLGVF
jgi:hypothetical protein